MTDTRSRKWNITINNPEKYGFTHDVIEVKLKELQSLVYYCLADEKGEVYHTHIYVHFNNAVRFSTIKNVFESAHIEQAKGTSQQNKEYIEKTGKWENSEKCGTKIDGTFKEYGTLPNERQGHRSDMEELYYLIRSGATNVEIYEQEPEYMRHHHLIDKVRQEYRYQENKNKFRKLDVTYIFGKTGLGKTHMIYENNEIDEIYRVTDYKHPFDNYIGQKIMVFDEYRSQLKISDMLNYIDKYPLTLPARYNGKQACYEIVYILSNWALREQYRGIQTDDYKTWEAFFRRINKLQEITENGIIEHDIKEHVSGYVRLPDDIELPQQFINKTIA